MALLSCGAASFFFFLYLALSQCGTDLDWQTFELVQGLVELEIFV